MEMSVTEVMGALRVSRDTVLRLIRAKELTAYRKSLGLRKSAYMVERASVEAYEKRRRA